MKSLDERVAALSDDSRELVEMVVSRLEQGRRNYGPLDLNTDPRDLLVEAVEEHVDSIVYTVLEGIRLVRRREAS